MHLTRNASGYKPDATGDDKHASSMFVNRLQPVFQFVALEFIPARPWHDARIIGGRSFDTAYCLLRMRPPRAFYQDTSRRV